MKAEQRVPGPFNLQALHKYIEKGLLPKNVTFVCPLCKTDHSVPILIGQLLYLILVWRALCKEGK